MARLVLIRDEDDLVAHKLRNITTIGRASLNHIVIDDPRYRRSTQSSRDQPTPIGCKIYIQQMEHGSMASPLPRLS
jgi:hypothetical protein